jgi:hypothetical protein
MTVFAKSSVSARSESAERGRRTQIHVEALCIQLSRRGSGGGEIEVALVRHPPDDWKPPSVWRKLVPVRARQHEDQRIAVELTERREALPGLEPHGIGGERPGGNDDPQSSHYIRLSG